MEVHAAPAVGKRLWSYVRAAFFMARNGVLSNKRKLLLTMHLLGANKRRGAKAVTRAVANLLSHHAHHGTASNAYPLRRREYEFSCSNSPADTAAASSSSSSTRRRLAYFPCLGAVAEEDYDYGYQQYDGYGSLSLPDAEPAPPRARIDYYASASSAAAASSPAPGEEEEEEYLYACASSASASPALLLPGAASGEFSVRVSNYSSEDEGGVGNQAVDADAEEFIRRFYDQLRRQNTVALLPYYMQQEIIAAA